MLFRKRIRADMGLLIPRLHALCHCRHDRALRTAPAAMRAVVQELAEEFILETTRTRTCFEVFRGGPVHSLASNNETDTRPSTSMAIGTLAATEASDSVGGSSSERDSSAGYRVSNASGDRGSSSSESHEVDTKGSTCM